MSTKIKSLSVVIARTLLGLIYFVIGLNYFIPFLPAQPAPTGVVAAFSGGLFQAGYFFPFLKGIEVILGAFLLAGVYVPLALVALLPITVNVLLFHVFLAPEGAAIGIVLVILEVYLAWAYREYFKPLFESKAKATA
ncbi:MAG TPA: hypothetical protein VFE57_04725 [Cyclobacteriaceae bacterium]|jgi:uncharacterized membrane protein YphA (DoxX/SURF4 family)|nr:hypothetical protein [Cyclobacteriaceae bacterium]